MSRKNELYSMLKTFGYDLNLNTSKDTLVDLLHLHSRALKHGIDVAKMNDHELRCYLNRYHIIVGPLIGHTRAIYQHQFLQAIDQEMNKGIDDNNEKLCGLSMNVDDSLITRSGRIIYRYH